IASTDPMEIDVRPMIAAIVDDTLYGKPRGRIASRFHTTLAEIIADVCGRIRRRDGINRVCLSGGTFQNFVLLERTANLLRKSGFDLFLHSRVPTNDGGISLGQAVIANQWTKAIDNGQWTNDNEERPQLTVKGRWRR
ncbi:MAG TPA: hypothetical protein VHX14_05705, partial [Thermoanaerobaculia bacterium]|nr:hypothetical protein [Thermoanaerobaculia bacterium]